MTETLAGAAAQLRCTAEMLGDAGARVAGADPGPLAFGADAPGRLGELTGDLRRLLQDCLAARGREAAAHADRLDRAAASLLRAAGDYAEVDHAAGRRAPEGA